MRAAPLTLALLVVGLAACRTEPPVPAPDGATIAADLVGTRFVFFEDEEGEKAWTIEEGEVKEVVVIDSVTSADGQSHRARIAIKLAAPNRTIRGELRAYYRLQDGRWVFDEAVREGDNFAVEEIAAVLYAAQPSRLTPGDSLYDAREVSLEPIARYVEGEYVAPFEPYREAIRGVYNASYEEPEDDARDRDDERRWPFKRRRPSQRDSLREAAFASLKDQIAGRYFNRAWTLYLLQPGAAPMPVRVRTRRAEFDGCEYVNGTVRAPSSTAAQGAHLATTSSTMGGRIVPGRPLRADEERTFVRMARARFQEQGVPEARLNRLRTDRLYAVSLDRNGPESWVGSFSIAEPSEDRGGEHLILIVSPSGGVPRPVFERYESFGRSYGSLDLIGVLDVDGDGYAEVILRESGYEVYDYRILSRPSGGDWQTVFKGGGGGC